MDKKYIECGKIINTHGCKGGLKIEPWCNSAEDFTALKSLYIKNKNEFIKYNVTKSSVFKQFVILELKEIDDMDKAIALKNITLYADREDFSLEDGEYFLTAYNRECWRGYIFDFITIARVTQIGVARHEKKRNSK